MADVEKETTYVRIEKAPRLVHQQISHLRGSGKIHIFHQGGCVIGICLTPFRRLLIHSVHGTDMFHNYMRFKLKHFFEKPNVHFVRREQSSQYCVNAGIIKSALYGPNITIEEFHTKGSPPKDNYRLKRKFPREHSGTS